MPPIEQEQTNRFRLAFVGVLIFLVALVGVGYWFNSGPSTKSQVSPFTLLKTADADFAQAVELVRQGGETKYEEARMLLEKSLQRAEEGDDEETIGLVKLWMAFTYSTATENKGLLEKYASMLVEVATNENYAARTRSYAYTYLGELFSRFLALRSETGDAILTGIIENEKLASHKATEVDGSLLFRQSAINILSKNLSLWKNSLLKARLASIVIRGVQNGAPRASTSENAVRAVVSLLNTAKEEESELREEEDTIPLYGEYLFLRAQTLATVENLYNGEFKSLVKDDVEELYNQAVQVTTSGTNRGTEASARYTFAVYLVQKFALEKKLGESPDQQALTNKLDSILTPFAEKPALRSTAMFFIIENAKARVKENPAQYQVVKTIAQYSPVFTNLLKEINAL